MKNLYLTKLLNAVTIMSLDIYIFELIILTETNSTDPWSAEVTETNNVYNFVRWSNENLPFFSW